MNLIFFFYKLNSLNEAKPMTLISHIDAILMFYFIRILGYNDRIQKTLLIIWEIVNKIIVFFFFLISK